MLIVTYNRYAECDYDKCHYAECRAVQMVVSILMKLKVKCTHGDTNTIFGLIKKCYGLSCFFNFDGKIVYHV